MATFQVDSTGSRIKTDILTNGYIRQNIEEKVKLLIPSEIKQLCFKYWFINVCDEWDKQFSNKAYEINGQCIKLVKNVYFQPAAFGSYVVKSGIFSWIIKCKTDINWMCIGIIEDDQSLLNKHINDADYDDFDYGGSFFNHRSWYFNATATEYGCKCGKKGDIIIMTLDINNHTIKFKINDIDYGIACDEMDKDKYRLVINCDKVDDEIELL